MILTEWLRIHWRWLATAIGGALFTVLSGFVGLWWALWVGQHDHTLALAAIQATQTDQAKVIADDRKMATDDFHAFQVGLQRWQRQSEQRDSEFAKEMRDAREVLGRIEGQLRKTAEAPSWWSRAAGAREPNGGGMH